jgi:hypothetical protein
MRWRITFARDIDAVPLSAGRQNPARCWRRPAAELHPHEVTITVIVMAQAYPMMPAIPDATALAPTHVGVLTARLKGMTTPFVSDGGVSECDHDLDVGRGDELASGGGNP